MGPVLLVVSGALFLAAIASLYATTMTVRRGRISPWTLILSGAGLLAGVAGVLCLV